MRIKYNFILGSFLFFLCFSQDTVQSSISSGIYNEKIDTIKFSINEIMNDSIIYDEDADIFESQLDEAKTIFSEAIISDLTGDTLEAMYQFDLLLNPYQA